MDVKTSWLFSSPTGSVKFLTCGTSYQLLKEKGVVCDTSVTEKILATLSWEVRSTGKAEIRILETVRINVVSDIKIEYLLPERMDGIRWLVSPEGRFLSVLNMKDVVDKIASAELIKRRVVPDFAHAMSLFYSKKTADRHDLLLLRKTFEDSIEREVRNFWWDIFHAYLPNEKGHLEVLPNFEFGNSTRVKATKTMKFGNFRNKSLVNRLDGLLREYVSNLETADLQWKDARWEYSSEVIYGELASQPHICTSLSRMEVTTDVKGEPFQDVYNTMLRRIFLWNGPAVEVDVANREINRFSSECRFAYQKDWAQFLTVHPAIQHELYSYVQNVYDGLGIGKSAKLNPAKIEAVLGKMLGHPNNEPQLVVDAIDSQEFCNHLMKDCYKTNYAFSHINFLFLRVDPINGYLTKLGGKLKNKWQERYFVLDRVLGLLVYWQKLPVRAFEPATGLIHMMDIQDVEKDVTPGKEPSLLLIPRDKTKKTYVLGVTQGEDLDRWMKELKKAMQEWQDLKIPVDSSFLKQIFRIRSASQFAVTHLQCVTEMPVEE